MDIKTTLSSSIQTEIQRMTDWAVKVRNSKLWPLFRPFYRVAINFINIEKLFGVQSKVLHAHRLRLYNLGFVEKTLSELQSLVNDNVFKNSAAWELALWHANQYTTENARKCLEFLKIAANGKHDSEISRGMTVLKAECHDILGEQGNGRAEVAKALRRKFHADLCLAAANLEQTLPAKIRWINKAFEFYGLSDISVDLSSNRTFFDHLSSGIRNPAKRDSSNESALVSVIIPAFNSEKTISTAIESLLSQTWKNLEILVVDDCSTDRTPHLVNDYSQKDNRLHLIRAAMNQGAYVARNIALNQATGEFVTCHDADDWSHPEKINKQVTHLLNNPTVIANISQLSRAGNDLKFFRRGNPGNYIQINMSSLMFRRKPVMEKAGYWDSVRFGADGEFLLRLKKIFGEKKIAQLKTGPLSILRQSPDSLTGNRQFGYHGFFMGARKEYRESHDYHHAITNSLLFEFPQKNRPFPVPHPMLPQKKDSNNRRHFDVIMVSDFRLPGGTTASNIEEIKAQTELGMNTGLVQMSRYDLEPSREINPGIRCLINGEKVQFIVYGEKASCDMLILRHPNILQERQRFIPDIKAKDIRVIINQTPLKLYGKNGRLYYGLKSCAKNMEYYFGQSGLWHPIGPLVRTALIKHHSEDLRHIQLSETNWYNIINVPRWKRATRPPAGKKVIIGRHSRDDLVKWPEKPDELLSIYPESDIYEIHILGGAEIPQKTLGYLPRNWRVYEFGSMYPKDFLSRLDVFVYYTHPDWVESFGRVIFEAMATGVPVIIPPVYKELFAEAAIYAEPAEVQEKIQQLMTDAEYYDTQVKKALAHVEQNFGYSQHAARLQKKTT
ncbi:MAG: glycosyltransferase [Desulfosalsimonadaceae bacterium]